MSKEAKNKKQLAAAAQEQEAIPVTGEVDCSTWNMLAQAGCDLR